MADFLRRCLKFMSKYYCSVSTICTQSVTSFTPVSKLEQTTGLCLNEDSDLKGVNILVGFENPSVIERYLKTVPRDYNTSKVGNGRMVYSAVSDFGHPETWDILPQIADFGLARPGDTGKTLREPIQAPLYTAPEVLMGTGWSYSADIWNLGVLVSLLPFFICRM